MAENPGQYRSQGPWQERYWSKVDKGGPDDCWPWHGTIDGSGYGMMGFGTFKAPVTERAHRLAYFLEHGPVRPKMVIDHLCRNRACVNPGHMEVVTRGENVRRGFPYREPKPFCKYGHPREPGRRACRECHRIRTLAAYHRNRAATR
jgi:hypothetical protein